MRKSAGNLARRLIVARWIRVAIWRSLSVRGGRKSGRSRISFPRWKRPLDKAYPDTVRFTIKLATGLAGQGKAAQAIANHQASRTTCSRNVRPQPPGNEF